MQSLDEACYLGSKAGWLLKEYELKKREHERLNAILKAEKEIKTAEQKLQQLTVKQ